ncbi:MAG: Gfo/Idh/MocA family protein [Acetivibrionales bacterium]|jgi:predicted dehydrogenase
MLNLGLIGLGNMGSLHLKNIMLLEQTGLCRLSCVCDIKKELAEKIGSECRVPAYASAGDMLEKEEIDAAIIATTSSSHFEIAMRLIEKRIPVLVEKPVVLSEDEAIQLKELALSKGVLISAGFTEVYNSVTTGVKSFFADKTRFTCMDFFRIGQKNSKNDTKDIDVVHDLMIHDIAVFAQLVDLNRVSGITGYLSSYNEQSGKYDMACVNMLLENGAVARFICDRNGTIKIRKFTLSLDDMYGEFDYMDQTVQVYQRGRLKAFGDNIWYSQDYDAAKIRYSNNPLYEEIKDFLLAVVNAGETKTAGSWFDVTMMVEKICEVLYGSMNRQVHPVDTGMINK